MQHAAAGETLEAARLAAAAQPAGPAAEAAAAAAPPMEVVGPAAAVELLGWPP